MQFTVSIIFIMFVIRYLAFQHFLFLCNYTQDLIL